MNKKLVKKISGLDRRKREAKEAQKNNLKTNLQTLNNLRKSLGSL
jgi:hypothetical protein